MLFAATWIDLEIVRLSKVNQTEKERYYMITVICKIQFLKMIQMNFFTKQKQYTRGGCMLMQGKTNRIL